MPLPANLKPSALKAIKSYTALNARVVPYHNAVHNALGGQMPNSNTSPGIRFSGRFMLSWWRCTNAGAICSPARHDHTKGIVGTVRLGTEPIKAVTGFARG